MHNVKEGGFLEGTCKFKKKSLYVRHWFTTVMPHCLCIHVHKLVFITSVWQRPKLSKSNSLPCVCARVLSRPKCKWDWVRGIWRVFFLFYFPYPTEMSYLLCTSTCRQTSVLSVLSIHFDGLFFKKKNASKCLRFVSKSALE